MFRLQNKRQCDDNGLLVSRLFDQNTFYPALFDDLKGAKRQVIIESPFIATKRINSLLPVFRRLRNRGVQIIINTKPLDEHEPALHTQAKAAIGQLQELGILVLFTGGHHRKLALVDKQVTWEGSLNILSQNDSCEFMRRICSEQVTNQMLTFLRLEKFIG